MPSRPVFGWAVALLLVAAEPRVAPAQVDPTFTRQADVIYGRKYGTALTMDVFTPKQNANGAAAILVVSGGWSSAHPLPPHSPLPLGRRTPEAGLYGLRGLPQQPAAIHDPRDPSGRQPRRALHPPPRPGLQGRPRPVRHLRGLVRRPPGPDAGPGG